MPFKSVDLGSIGFSAVLLLLHKSFEKSKKLGIFHEAMDMGPRLLVVRAAPGGAESEVSKASRGDRRISGGEFSEITMNLRTRISREEFLHLLTELIYFVLYMHQQMPWCVRFTLP